MLAFNLGVFFRNLKGEEVVFSAETPQCKVGFTGGVRGLDEQTDLTHHLSVTLVQGDLSFSLAFDEDEEDEEPEDARVDVRLVQQVGEGEILLLETNFRFGDISLKPASEGEGSALEGNLPEDDDKEPA